MVHLQVHRRKGEEAQFGFGFTFIGSLQYFYLNKENHLYIFHGYDAISTNYITDIIKISLERLGEDQLTYEIIKVSGDVPAPRGNASVCLVGNTVFIFGGGCVDDAYGDLWMWEI